MLHVNFLAVLLALPNVALATKVYFPPLCNSEMHLAIESKERSLTTEELQTVSNCEEAHLTYQMLRIVGWGGLTLPAPNGRPLSELESAFGALLDALVDGIVSEAEYSSLLSTYQEAGALALLTHLRGSWNSYLLAWRLGKGLTHEDADRGKCGAYCFNLRCFAISAGTSEETIVHERWRGGCHPVYLFAFDPSSVQATLLSVALASSDASFQSAVRLAFNRVGDPRWELVGSGSIGFPHPYVAGRIHRVVTMVQLLLEAHARFQSSD